MSKVNESRSTWTEELTRLVDDNGPRSYDSRATSDVPAQEEAAAAAAAVGKGEVEESWKFHMVEFAKGFGEMSLEFGKGVRDVVKQSILREDSVIVKKLRGPCQKACGKLRFLNEYLPEDRDPVHAWSVILLVSFLAFVGNSKFFS